MSKQTEYVIVCRAYQLFWCGDRFSHNIKDAQTYSNLRGPRVAIAILGKAKGKNRRARWEHVLNGADFEVLPTNEVLKLAQKWKAEDRKASFYNEEALSDPYYLYSQRKTAEEEKSEEVRPNCKEVAEDLSDKTQESLDKPQVVDEMLKITEATPPAPTIEVSAVQKPQHAVLMERYATARRQITEAQALLSEAEQEMRAVEAELDIVRIKKEFA